MTLAGRRILFHDYGGHGFTAQIAREMARRGAMVRYLSCASFPTPKGRVERRDGDADTFGAEQLSLPQAVDKDNLLRRHRQQLRYAHLAAARVRAWRPDIVFSSNAPLEVQQRLLRATHEGGGRFVFWMQDIHSDAIRQILGRRSAALGQAAGSYYRLLERRLIAQSDATIVISEAFRERVLDWGVDGRRLTVVENWAPLTDLPERDNAWARRHMREGRTRLVYAGTLARKHDPDMLLLLARSLDVDVHLFSEGSSAAYVQEVADREGLGNVFVRPWVAADELPEVLAGADLLYAGIAADAASFSVPSKVLAYLAAGRPILASIPPGNLAGGTVVRADAGLVSRPDDPAALLVDARRLLADGELRARMGANGRRYAVAQFDIAAIGDRFAAIVSEAGAERCGDAAGAEPARAVG